MKIAARLLLLLTLLGPAGCYLRMGSPCEGFGCPAFTPKGGAPSQPAPAQSAQQPSHHHFHWFKHNAQSQNGTNPATKSGQ